MSRNSSDPKSRKTPEPEYVWGELVSRHPEVVWEHSARPLWAQAVPAADAVFLIEKQRLLCRGLRDGELRWEQPAEAMPEELAVDAGAAAVAVGQDLRFLDLATGAQRWSKRLGGDANGLLSDGHTLYATAVQRSRGVVFALQRDTGEIRWRAAADAEVEISVCPEANLLVLDDPDTEKVLAFDSRTGERRWEFGADGEPTVVGPLAGGVLLVSAYGAGVVGLDADTGEARWRLEGGGSFEAPAVVMGDRAYVTDGQAYALDPATGDVLWSREPADEEDRVYAIYAVGETLLAETWRGRLLSLDPLSGSLRWEASLGQVQGVTGDSRNLYFRLNRQQRSGPESVEEHWSVLAVERTTGEPQWELYARRQVPEITTVGDDRLVVELKNQVLVLRTGA